MKKSKFGYYSQFINQTFGKLTIKKIYPKLGGGYSSNCLCECGNSTSGTNVKRVIDGKLTMCKSCSGKINGRKGNDSKLKTSRYNKYIGTQRDFFFIERRSIEGEPNGTFKCICGCGNIRFLDAYSLRTKESKSCGCKQKQLLSLASGGTGIPYEDMSLNDCIRKTDIYERWKQECLKLADYTCNVSNQRGGKLNVHHLIPLSTLVKENNITKENISDFHDILFNVNNGIVLREDVHKKFHSSFGKVPTPQDFETFKNKYIKNI
jgi:hypothetical protein